MEKHQAVDPISRLIEEFRNTGVSDLAERLQAEFWAGATGTECRGRAGNALREIVADMSKSEFVEFRPLILECEAYLRSTRPSFRVVPLAVKVRHWIFG
jgi:hypothetical protein